MVRPVPEVARDPEVQAALDALAAGDAHRAEAICRPRLARQPDAVEWLRLLGRTLTIQGRFDEAEATLRRALGLRPTFARLHEDIGGVLAMQRRFDEAVASFRETLRLDPESPLAGKHLALALAALGKGAEADSAFEAWFGQDKARVALAVALDHLQAGRKDQAIAGLTAALRRDPDNVDVMHTLAQAWWGDEAHRPDIEALLRRVTERAPAHVSAWVLLGSVLHDTDRPEEAIPCYRRATEIEPGNAAAWIGLGADYALVGDMACSAEAYRRALSIRPGPPGVHMSHAHSLKSLGRLEESLREYRAAIASKPDFGEAYWSMANLKVFRFEPSEVAAMEDQLARGDLTANAEVHFRFALGKAYEDAGDYDRAWQYYQSGNQRQRPLVSYDPVGFETRHEKIVEIFTPTFLEAHRAAGHESGAPIFIVGLPRSGSTLIEQILASHSEVEGTLELPILGEIAVSVGRFHRSRREYPEAVLDLHARDFRACGQRYLEEAGVYRYTQRPRFTDKLPNNFSHIGFLHLILPNAVVINARRHPLDSCLGSYKQLFGKGQHFTYDFQELGLYYRQYHETMKHWHRVLPGKVLDVHYEDTVLDFEAQVRRILAHCGLPFEDACLRFHETERVVRTASSEQVRQPLYARALGTWRRYEKHLGPWQEELADIIAELPERVRNAGL